MAKKNDLPIPPAPVVLGANPPAGVSVPADAQVALNVLEEDIPFHVGTWAGLVNYECKYCPEGHLDEVDAWEHYMVWHQMVNQAGERVKARRSLPVPQE